MHHEKRRRSSRTYIHHSFRDENGVTKRAYIGSSDSQVASLLYRTDQLRLHTERSNDRSVAIAKGSHKAFANQIGKLQKLVRSLIVAYQLLVSQSRERPVIGLQNDPRIRDSERFGMFQQRFLKEFGMAKKGNQAALGRLAALLQPDSGLWEEIGGISQLAIETLLNCIAGDDQEIRQKIESEANNVLLRIDQQEERRYSREIDRQLQIVCYLAYLDVLHIHLRLSQSKPNPKDSVFWSKQLDASNSRFLQTVNWLGRPEDAYQRHEKPKTKSQT